MLLAQTDIVWENPRENLDRIERLVTIHLSTEPDLLILPEMFSSGFTMRPEQVADADAVSWMQQRAFDWRISILGSLVESTMSGYRNTVFLVAPSGAVRGTYSKVHLFGQEREHYQAGENLLIFEVSGFQATVFICYDLRFPEMFRAACARGVEVFFVVANWPAVRQSHWKTLLPARALENQSFVCACNRVGKDPDNSYLGGSSVYLPDGRTLLELGCEEELQLAVLDRSELESFRSSLSVLADRRQKVYRCWDSELDV